MYMTWNLNSLSTFWTIFISCELLEWVWEIMRRPRFFLAHYPSISSNITNAIDFRMPPTPLMLAHHPPCPRWRNTHLVHAGPSPMLAGQPRNLRYQLFLVRFQWSSGNPKWRCFSSLHGATCDFLISPLPHLAIWERKAVRMSKV